MEEKIIIREIEESNKWWKEKFEIPIFKNREIYNEIRRFMKSKQIIAITGLRRVGKTTIMLKIIEEYLKNKFPNRNIFYFSFDNYSSVRIIEIIDAYEKITGKNIKNEKYLFAFDEIQKIKNWEEQLKRIYDMHPNIKFIVSGSESLFIRKKSRESLAGRIFEFRVNTLNFKEYLEFKGKKYDNLLLYQKEIIKEFNKFLLSNGFPEVIDKEQEFVKKYIQEAVIDKIIYHDMGEIFEIKNISVIKTIFNIIYNNPGQIIEIQKLAGEIGITRHVLSEYLDYLEEAYLIKKLYNYSKNARKTERRLKKYYSTIINPLLINSDFPKIFEQAMAIQLKADYFWRDSYKNEIDIIKIDPLSAIEIKSGDIKNNSINSLKIFGKKFKPKRLIILAYDIKKRIDNIEIIPFYEFIL